VKGLKIWIILTFFTTTTLFSACDKPEIKAFEKEYKVSAEGGELSILIHSTGVDKVVIPEKAQSWLTHKETIETRALLVLDEDVLLDVKPNSSSSQRNAQITLFSFNKSIKIRIIQEGK